MTEISARAHFLKAGLKGGLLAPALALAAFTTAAPMGALMAGGTALLFAVDGVITWRKGLAELRGGEPLGAAELEASNPVPPVPGGMN